MISTLRDILIVTVGVLVAVAFLGFVSVYAPNVGWPAALFGAAVLWGGVCVLGGVSEKR